MAVVSKSSEGKVLEALERIEERLDSMESIQKLHGTMLEEHVRRSLLNEEHIKIAREEHKALVAAVEPLRMHVAAWGGVSKALTVLATLSGLLFGAWKLFT